MAGGEAGAPRGGLAAGGGKFPGRSLLAPQQGAPGSACLPAPGKLKFLSHLGCFEQYLGCSLLRHQAEAGGDAEEELLLHERTQFCPHGPSAV